MSKGYLRNRNEGRRKPLGRDQGRKEREGE